MSYNVLVVEDQKMPRKLFEIYISSSPDYTLLASISNADLAYDICLTKKVDLILMDVVTEYGNSGLAASKKIKKAFPKIKIIIVTSMPEYSWLKKAKSIGVDSFWYKESAKEDILSIMNKTMNGESIYPDEPPLVKIGEATNHDFTEKELCVLKELLTGDSNTEIGKRLNISSATVKWYVEQLLFKTGFHSRTELATVARSLGIVIK